MTPLVPRGNPWVWPARLDGGMLTGTLVAGGRKDQRVTNDHSSKTSGLTRRLLLEWLGAGAVLALGGDLLAALAATPPGEGLGFRPGPAQGPPFVGWNERTVDPQDLASLLATWRLEVGGLVARPATYAFADLVALPRTDLVADFHCVEGWSVPDVPWNGVRLAALLDRAEPSPEAKYVHFLTVGGFYNDSLPLPVAREPQTLLAYGVAGSTLPLAHGFPLRVVAPRLLGYKNAKYVARLELAAEPLYGFWVKAGYDYRGDVPPSRLRPPPR